MEYKKIKKEDFDKLQKLFPGTYEMWIKYREKRLKELDK